MATIKREDVLSYLETANMLEISDLIKWIEEKFNVSAAAPVAVAAGAPAAAGGDAAEAKTEFDVELTSVGDKKINVIKVIREIIQNIPHRPILMDDIIKFLNENPTVRDYNQHSNWSRKLIILDFFVYLMTLKTVEWKDNSVILIDQT